MSTNSNIEWTEATWNPVAGCSVVSPGCTNCYAMRMAARLEAMGQAKYAGTTKKVNGLSVWTGLIHYDMDALFAPLGWKKPRRVFVNSMSDLFHEKVASEFVDRVFAVMALTPQHTYQILTKRPERMEEYLTTLRRDTEREVGKQALPIANEAGIDWDVYWRKRDFGNPDEPPRWPLKNVWLGTSCEDQRRADERIPRLLKCPAAVRFLSCEPLLSTIDLTAIGEEKWDVTRGWKARANNEVGWANTPRVDWVIVGGESGAGSRPCSVEWVRSLVEQCAAVELPCFVKQLGAKPVTDRTPSGTCRGQVPVEWYPPVKLRDGKGGNPDEWPADLRVRQFPAAASARVGACR